MMKKRFLQKRWLWSIFCLLLVGWISMGGASSVRAASGETSKALGLEIVTLHNNPDLFFLDYFQTSPKKIEIGVVPWYYADPNLDPEDDDFVVPQEKADGFLVLRRDLTNGDQEFKQIGDILWTDERICMTFADKTVKASHTYEYMVRPYVLDSGKTRIYGADSLVVRARATYAIPKVTTKVIQKYIKSNGTLVVRLKSNKKNDVILFDRSKIVIGSGIDDGANTTKSVKISTNGRKWKKAGKTIKLKPGKTLYFKVQVKKAKRKAVSKYKHMCFRAEVAEYGRLTHEDVNYAWEMLAYHYLKGKGKGVSMTGEFDD